MDWPALVEALETVEVEIQQVVDGGHRVGHPALGDLEHHRLGVIDRLGDVVGQLVAQLGDLAGHADHAAQQRMVLDDLGVPAGVGRGRRARLQAHQRGRAADGVEQARPAQLVGDGHRVGRLAGAVERGDGLVDVAVGGLVEVVGPQALGRHGDGVLGQEHRPQEGLLGLEVVRGDPAGTGRVASPDRDLGGAHQRTGTRGEGRARRIGATSSTIGPGDRKARHRVRNPAAPVNAAVGDGTPLWTAGLDRRRRMLPLYPGGVTTKVMGRRPDGRPPPRSSAPADPRR